MNKEDFINILGALSTDAMRARDRVRYLEKDLSRANDDLRIANKLLMDHVNKLSEDEPSLEDHYEGTNIKLL